MQNYLFSIFIRGFVAISGFLVFLITAKIFGAEGRGIISYGTSLYASVGILLSCSLGRVFLKQTLKDDELKIKYLPDFITINLLISILTICASIGYWLFSDSAKEILSFSQLLGFCSISFFYVWFHNGHPIFSAFSQTKMQDQIILAVRTLLVLFLLIFWLLNIQNINYFIWFYSLLLFIGVFAEMLVLKKISKQNIFVLKKINLSFFKKILSESIWSHVDYVSFNILPLLLVVFSAKYLGKSDLGRANFAIQIINVIFLLSTAANMRIAMYVSNVGFAQRILQVKKLFWFTLAASVAGTAIVYAAILIMIRLNLFPSFGGVEKLFLISAISVVGYLTYQFLTPIWIELNLLKQSATLNFFSAAVTIALLPYFIKNWDVDGLVILFSLFHTLVLISNTFIYLLYKKSLHVKN